MNRRIRNFAGSHSRKSAMAYVITPDQLGAIAGASTPLMPALADWINQLCPSYDIDTPQEFCHFLAQACHETDHFRTLREYASGRAYEGRADLGNTRPGDGVKFRGRGVFQTTGRGNYLQLGIKQGRRDMFIKNPELPGAAPVCRLERLRILADTRPQRPGQSS